MEIYIYRKVVIGLKLRYLILIIVTFVFILSGCSSKIEVMAKNVFIANLTDIDLIQIDYEQESSKQTTDKELINEIYKNIIDIKLEKLSIDKENALMQNNKVIYSIVFISEHNVVGSVMVFPKGIIYMPDIATLGNNQRTVSYVHYNFDNQRLQNLISIFEKLK